MFWKNRKTFCKECANAYAKQYRAENKNIIAVKNKKWYSTVGKEWKKEYDKSRLELVRDSDRERYQNDPQYRIKKVLRTRLYKTIKGTKSSKQLLQYIGIPLADYKQWIEFQWQNDWSWQNYGKVWEIDHVMPCDSFDLTQEEEKHKCFHWSNTRPLSCSENLAKSASIDHTLIETHKHIVDIFTHILNTSTKDESKDESGVEKRTTVW